MQPMPGLGHFCCLINQDLKHDLQAGSLTCAGCCARFDAHIFAFVHLHTYRH